MLEFLELESLDQFKDQLSFCGYFHGSPNFKGPIVTFFSLTVGMKVCVRH